MERNLLKTVLYVDDEPDIREIVALSLGLVDDLTIHTCGSGAQAIAGLPSIQPDLVLMDVMMPAMDGPATLGQMRADPATARIPVVFVTAKAMPQQIAQLRELGAAGVIAKPFDPMLLGQQVVTMWEQMADE